MKTNKPLSFIAAALLLTAWSFGQKAEKPQVATQIESVKLQVQNDGDKAYFHFSEGVKLTATNMLVECDSLEVFATREAEEQSQIGKFSAIKEIIASGNVRIIQEERTATCQKAVVQPNEERIVLTGNPVVVQPSGRLVTYNPDDKILLDRGNGRISIITDGPRKLKLTGSAISDLGFENQGPIPTSGEDTVEQEDGEATEATAEETSENSEENDSVEEQTSPDADSAADAETAEPETPKTKKK
ncbi:LptA/OstA family protein [Pelagicoccus albus]|uniref:Organic solvent tolerance-like N-terminal domain-containing protein n=1 Tax=Pelagicoccus albus TaxID=415222 RepID=A0A7X1B3R5_9BACT|nr:LptA/OstA family protein [Pelagicoccus albus]MBC2605052.1 hypothetical protein [Pelagicoccus albus]